MTIYGRVYKTIALCVVLGLFASLLPMPVWGEIIGAPIAYAAPGTSVAADTEALFTPASANDEINQLMSSIQDVLPPETAEKLGALGMLTPEGEPNGMLLGVGALQNLPNTPLTEPLTLAHPLSVSRVQSAYAATAAIANTLIVTFTVTNNRPPSIMPEIDPSASITDTIAILSALDFSNDPNVIRNVLLTDELLPPQATFVESFPDHHHENNVYAWNMGDISPLESVTVTLKLMVPASVGDFIELDTGAAAWGTLNGRAVTNQTAPITLAPDGYEGWLICTIDANCNDEYVVEKAAELGNDASTIFTYVRSLGFESYIGSLRGARGTLWSEAGNSMDQASLLIALLRASGVPAAYRHGDLEMPLRRQLILSMFPQPQGVIGHIPEGTAVADPANDPQLLEETRDHWWVQAYLPGLGWTQLDPTFANADIGDSFVPFPSPDQLAEVPDGLRHKVNLKVQVEEYHPFNLGQNGGLTSSYPLTHQLNSVELVGEPVTLSHLVNTTSSSGAVFFWVRHTYTPYLVIGDQTISGNSYQDLISNFPFGTFIHTAVWLNVEQKAPHEAPETYQQTLVDRIGFENRFAGGELTLDLQNNTNPLVTAFDTHTIVFAPSFIPTDPISKAAAEAHQLIQEKSDLFVGEVVELSPEEERERTAQMQQALVMVHKVMGLEYFRQADNISLDYGSVLGLALYHQKPSLVAINTQVLSEDDVNISLEPLTNNLRALNMPGQAEAAANSFRFQRGVIESTTAGVVVSEMGNVPNHSTANVFATAVEQDVGILAIDQSNLAIVKDLPISKGNKNRITLAVTRGSLVIIPALPVTIDGADVTGWWEVTPQNGMQTTGITSERLSSTENQIVSSTSMSSAELAVTPKLQIMAKAASLQGLVTGAIRLFTFLWQYAAFRIFIAFIAGLLVGVIVDLLIAFFFDPCNNQDQVIRLIIESVLATVTTALGFITFLSGPEAAFFFLGFGLAIAAMGFLRGQTCDERDNDGDNIPDKDECPGFGGFSNPDEQCRDSDGDGNPDYKDDDSDNDGVPDRNECRDYAQYSNCPDGDGDGEENYRDNDSDNDGDPDPNDPDDDNDDIPDVYECPGNNFSSCRDSDGDRVPDYQDNNSNNIYPNDDEECPYVFYGGCPDSNGDGIPDYRDTNEGFTFSYVSVASGQTLSTIAQTYNVTPYDIQAATNLLGCNRNTVFAPNLPQCIENLDHIEPGWRVRVPTADPAILISHYPNSTLTYAVNQGYLLDIVNAYLPPAFYPPGAQYISVRLVQAATNLRNGCTQANPTVLSCIEDVNILVPGDQIYITNPLPLPIIQDNSQEQGNLPDASPYLASISERPLAMLTGVHKAAYDESPLNPLKSPLGKSLWRHLYQVEITSTTTSGVPLAPAHLHLANAPSANNDSQFITYQGVVTSTATPFTADVQTGHAVFDGYMKSNWQSSIQAEDLTYRVIKAASATVRLPGGEIVGSGSVAMWAAGDHIALRGSDLSYQRAGWNYATNYAPALPGLGMVSDWSSSILTTTASSFESTLLNPNSITINGNLYGSGQYLVEFNSPVVIWTDAPHPMPLFTGEWGASMSHTTVQLGHGNGTAVLGTTPLDTTKGAFISGFNGTVTVTEQTATTDRIQFTGTVDRYVEAVLNPSTSSVIPTQASQFHINMLSNATDTYYLEVSAPEGWDVDLDNSGVVTVTPGINIAEPGDYTILVTAQTLSRPMIVTTAVHTVTIQPHQGMVMDVTPEQRFTVPWGTAIPGTIPGHNDGRLQLPGAAFTTIITNTSTVPHTFDVDVNGLPDGWLILSGAEGGTGTSITLPAGGVGQVGLYVSPAVPALPPAGTTYPFNVIVTAVDTPSLTQSDADVFTVPAIAFNYVTADPKLVYVSPDTAATFDLNILNIGTTAGSFPITLTLPVDTWTSSYANSTGSLAAGATHNQTVTFTPVGAAAGDNRQIRIISPAPGTTYVQTTHVQVAVRAPEVVCAYNAVLAVPAADPGLAAALDNLVTQLERWPDLANLAQRDRAVAAIQEVALQLSAYPGLAVTGQFSNIAAQMSAHTTPADLAVDRSVLGDILCQDLQPVLALITAYNPSLSIFPGVLATVPGRTVTPTLSVANYGDTPATAVFALSGIPAGWNVITPTQVSLQPGVAQQIPLPVTPNVLGTNTFSLTMRLAEAPELAITRAINVRVVSELLHITEVALSPNFLNVGTGTTQVNIRLANLAGLRAAATADVQLTDAAGAVRKTLATPFTVAVNNSGPFLLGDLDIDGLEPGVYTATVRLLDPDGSLIPNALGSTFLSIGQDLEVTYEWAPMQIAPGQTGITVTTTITTQRTDVPTTTIPFTPTVKWSRSAFSAPTNYNQVVSLPAVGDINLDGIPDIVFAAYRPGNPNSDGVLRVISGDDGSELFSVSNSSWRVMPLSSPIIVDLENDGIPEIVAERNIGGLIAFSNTGNAKYISSAFMNPAYGSLPVVADVNDDGLPEIIVGRFVVNNTLSSVTSLGNGPGGGSDAALTSIVGDVNLDGTFEVIAGNTIYSSAGGILAQNTSIPAITTLGLGNFDNDPEAEIVVVDPFGSRVFLVDHQMNIIWGPVAIPLTGSAAFGNGGTPTVADFDGDGAVEIGIAGASDYVVYDTNGTILWQDPNVNDSSSGVTGSSVFDFQGDGQAEVVYADQQYLKVYNGADGTILFQTAHSSSTAFELPVIADVDADGHAEIIVSQNNDFTGSFTGIRVFEAEDDSWLNTRQLWYQQAYDITSLTDNARVVTNPTPVWLLYNTFRSQASTPTQGNTYFIDIRHSLPLSGTSLLADTVAPLPLDLTSEEIHWLYSQQDREATKVNELSQIVTSALQPGEVRQLSTGTVISYTRNNNNTVLMLPPFYVSAPHIITISPDTQVTSPATAVPYTVTLTNAFLTTQVVNLSILGIPPNWVSLTDTVTLNSGETVQVPLVVTVPADAAIQEYDFMVRALLADGGEDVTSATLSVRSGPQLHISPSLQFVPYGQTVTYGFILTNTTSQAEHYTFAVNGLGGLPVGLPAATQLAAGESLTGIMTVTAQTTERTIPFQVQANGDSGLSADAEAGLGLLNGPDVTAVLSPATALAGRGTPARYTLTVTNTGSIEDTYSFSANLPPGWSYQLVANGLPVDSLSLTPFVFNSANLQLLVTPAVTTTPAIYPVQLLIVSQSDPETSATAVAQAQVTSQGVQLHVSPPGVTMSPTGSQTWNVTVTNTGEVADTFRLHASGIVSATAQFVPASVSLSPGASTIVQLTAADLNFALPRTYPFAVTARSTVNPAISNTDNAEVTFTGFEAVSVSITPTLKVIDGFISEHQFFMVFTNTGNIGTVYDLSGLVTPAGTLGFEVDQVYVPAHMAAGVLVNLLVPSTGTYDITVQVTSASSAAADAATATLIINSLNTPPQAVDDSATTTEATPVTIPVLTNDSDADGDTLTIATVTQPANGTVTHNGTTITYTPNANFTGSDSFTYTINDGHGGADTATVSVTVTPGNNPPTATNDTAVAAEDTAVTIPVLANDSDEDGDTLSVSAVTQPAHGTVTHTSDDATYTPNTNYHGTDSFTYSVSDGHGGSGTAVVTITVTAVNDTPLAAADNITTAEDTAVIIDVLANDSDVDGDTLSVNTITQPGNGMVVINPDNTVTYTPDPDFNSTDSLDGTDTFTYTVSDGHGAQAAAQVTVTVTPVNDAPVAADDTATSPEDGSVIVTVLANDSDVDGDPLTVVFAAVPAHGITIVNADHTVTYIPTANFNGVDSFTYTVSDGHGGSDTAVVTITVTPMNDTPVANNDTAVTTEDTAVMIDVLANDTDVDEDSLTVTEVTAPLHGAAAINPDNTVTYTPTLNYNGSDSFTYTASDGQGGAATAVVTVTVTPLNDMPTAVDDSASTAEDTPVSIDVLANDTDVDGDALAVAAVTQPAHGAATVNGDDTITYTPDENFNGNDTFSYTVEDGHGGSDTAVVTITITPINDSPVAADDNAATAEDMAVTLNVLANDTDVDGDTLSITAVTTPTQGTAVVNADDTITYTPAPDFYGSDSFNYTISDGQGDMDTATVTITITPVNDAPTAHDDAVTTAEDTAVIITVLSNDADVDGDSLVVSGVTSPTVGTATVNGDSTITYTPPANFNGVATFTYTISDGHGGTDTATVTVTVTEENDNPTANDDHAVTPEDTPVTLDVLANDTDTDGDALSVTSVTQPANGTATLNADGSVTYTPDINFFGADNFTYTISDGHGGSDTAVVIITITSVNDDPVAGADNAVTTEDTAVIIDVLANDTDVDGDALNITGIITPTQGTAVVNADNTITYTPAPDYHGSDSFTYTISDGHGGHGTASVVVTVTPVNDAPIANDDSRTTPEDTAVTINVLANDTDVDSDALAVTSISTPINGSIVLNPDHTVTYTPAPNYHGNDSFSYTISDGHGGSDTATVSLTVTSVNDAPTANNDQATTLEDTAVTLDVLANDSDVDGDSLTVSAVTQGDNGAVVINSDNSVTYTPDPDFNSNDSFEGTDVFTYTVSDGNGGSDVATVTIVVTPVNDAPVAVNDNATTPEDTAITLDVLANDSDVDGDVLTVTAVTTPTAGITVLHADNTVTYTPNPDFNGVATFSYSITDGHGGSDTAVVTIAVNPVNDTPVAANDNATTPEDTAVTINLLANDTDVDGDTLVVSTVTTPTHGTVMVNPDNTVTYTPAPNYHGSDTFAYTVSDGHGGHDTAVVTITVTPVNDAPVANDDSVSTAEDTAVTVDVLANDTDVDGDALLVSSVTQPAHGLVTINADNSVTYAPDAGFAGEDSFSYSIDDGQGGTDTAVVTVSVTAENDNPVANDDSVTITEDTAVTIDVLANDTDADGDVLVVTGVTQPTNGVVVINPDDSLTYTPTAHFYGIDSFSYTISDGHGGSDTAVVTITVTPVNDAPVAVNDSATTPQDTAVTIDVLANDTDVDGDALSVESMTQPMHGLVMLDANDHIVYTPAAGYNGPDSFTYTVSDGNGGTDTAAVTISVTPASGACNLYPIALHADSLAGVNVGDILTEVMNGQLPGNFGWLTWTGDNSVPALAASLTPPGNSHTYINPYDPNDHTVSVDDWVEGKPGVSNARSVRDALDTLMTMDITIPVWDNVTGGGANANYQVSAFVSIRLLSYNLVKQDRITLQFLGYTTCHVGNASPTGANDAAATVQDTPLIIDVLANDNDLDGDTLTVTSVTAPAQGTAVINPDNSITYTPNAGFTGTDSFLYALSDGQGGSDTATVVISVTPTPAACELYPIALSAQMLLHVQAGDTFYDIINGNSPGQFGWLAWDGAKDVPSLAASLTPPGNSHTYVNPSDANDHMVSVGDWVWGKPGASNAQQMRDALAQLTTRGLVVPVWDLSQGPSGGLLYRISAFAKVKLLDYHLPQTDKISIQFLEYVTCAEQVTAVDNAWAGGDVNTPINTLYAYAERWAWHPQEREVPETL